MFSTKDLLDLLDRIPVWKRLGELPAKLDEANERIAALEKRLERMPGEGCPKCGALAMRLDKAGRPVGPEENQRRTDTWKCVECGHSEIRTVQVSHR
ncbi:hypothetical protein [Methylobacterium sp. Leaf91]|uniref:hypothetical protein n=1 Tax=Methylobacterium sp. Leaf91 TaxID=1736247 RepID=UPI0006FDB9B9|nr:hypothetical protein [Methylobacterium sp. Leaf91]KQO94661.1 hypothetical protein ASF32_19300 [Methylobacterium sp. Leaf91]